VFTQMASEDPLLFLQIGDLHYEDISANELGLRMTAIDKVMGSPSQARLYSNAALAYMWDDHDWLGNDSEGEGQGRDAALQSYQVAFPHYTPLPDNSSSLPSPYHAFTIGTVRFVLMDLRSQATHVSIYSEAQKQWLFRELNASPRYDFVVLISSKPWIDVDSNVEEDDSWAAYPDNRSELSAHISSMTKKNLLMIASDAHMVAFDDGSNTFYGKNQSLSSSFPILQTGPMDRLGSVKGGPFSDGCYTVRYERSHQYSVVAFSTNGSVPCLTVTSKDAVGNRILTRSLCGSNIFHNTTTSGTGTCSASSVSSSTTAMLGASCAILVLMCMIALKFIGCCTGLVIFCTSLVLSFATLGLGIGIPLAKGIKQFDTNAIASIVIAQVVVVFVYVLFWARVRRASDSSDAD
jgi:PhoD-like phosphatase